MKSLKSALLALIVAAGIAGAANAQVPPTAPTQKPFAVKLGLFFPSDGDIKDIMGSTVFNFGLGYDVGKFQTKSPVVYGAYVDGAFGKKTHSTLGVDVKGEASFVGVGGQARYYFGAPTTNFHFYGGAGIGVYFLHGKARANASEGENTISANESKNKTSFGGKLFAGAEFAQGFLGELTYHFPGSVEGAHLNGFGINVGYRF